MKYDRIFLVFSLECQMKEMTSLAQNGRTQDVKRELSLDCGMKDKCDFCGPYAREGAQKGVRHLLCTFLS